MGKLLKQLLLLWCCLVFVAILVYPQSRPVFEIDIPFDFVVKDKTFPLGKYKFGRLDPANPDILILKNTSDKKKMIFVTQRLATDSQKDLSELIFYRFGNISYLHSVWPSGQKYGSQLLPGKLELNDGRGVSKPQMVSLQVK